MADEVSACEAATLLSDGRIIAVPTSRWFMLATLSSIDTNVELIYSAKRRDRGKPLLTIPTNPVERVLAQNPDLAPILTEYWPGDLFIEIVKGHDVWLISEPDGQLGLISMHVQLEISATAASLSSGYNSSYAGPACTVEALEEFLHATELPLGGYVAPSAVMSGVHAAIVQIQEASVGLKRVGIPKDLTDQKLASLLITGQDREKLSGL